MAHLLILSETRLYREALAEALQRQPGLRVAGTAGDAGEGLERAIAAGADLLLVDATLPGALDLIRALGHEAPAAHAVLLGLPEDEDAVVACAEAGAAGYLARDASLEELVEAIRSVERGELICSPRTAGMLLRRLAWRAAAADVAAGPATAPSLLTRREAEILHLIDDGLSNKEIAVHLGIEVATVKNHVHNLLRKLHVRRRSEAAARTRPASSARS